MLKDINDIKTDIVKNYRNMSHDIYLQSTYFFKLYINKTSSNTKRHHFLSVITFLRDIYQEDVELV